MGDFFSIEVLWRLVRGAVAATVAQAFATQIDWSNTNQAMRTLGVSLLVGFLLALGKGIRDTWGHSDPVKGVVNKLPV